MDNVPPTFQFEEVMKTILIAIPMVILLAGALFLRKVCAQPKDHSAQKLEGPLACDRLAFTPEQRKRHFDELGPALRSRKTAVRELHDGFEFRFPSDDQTYRLVTEWMEGERVCCPFFEINLRSEPDGGPLWLRLTGRDGVKQFLETEGVAWIGP